MQLEKGKGRINSSPELLRVSKGKKATAYTYIKKRKRTERESVVQPIPRSRLHFTWLAMIAILSVGEVAPGEYQHEQSQKHCYGQDVTVLCVGLQSIAYILWHSARCMLVRNNIEDWSLRLGYK